MNKAKRTKMVHLVSAIVIELAAVIIIAKSIATDSSPTQGIILLGFGLVFLVIGITRKTEDTKKDAV